MEKIKFDKRTPMVLILNRGFLLIVLVALLASYLIDMKAVVNEFFGTDNSILLLIVNLIRLLLVIILALYTLVQPFMQYKKSYLQIDKNFFIYKHGWLFSATDYVLINKLQQVEVNTNVVLEMFKVSRLKISTSFNSFETLPLPTEYAQKLSVVLLEESKRRGQENGN